MSDRGALAAVAAVILGGVAGYLGYRWYLAAHEQGPVPVAVSSVAAGDDASDEAAAGLKIPETLPDIHLAGLDGRMRALSEFGHRPLIVNFWATWCEPCRREMPLLTALRAEHQAERLEVVGIAVDFRDSVSEFLKKTPLSYPLLIGEEDGIEAAKAFGMQMLLPFSVFIDEQNRVVAVKVGELHRDEADAILEAMRRLRTGAITLAATRADISAQLKQLGVQRSLHRQSAR